MTISIIQPLFAGNALRLFLTPPAGTKWWRVLKKGSDDFSGATDPAAVVAYEGDEKVIVDATALQNGVRMYYRPYYLQSDNVTWQEGPTSSGVPNATYQEHTTDALSFVRDRLSEFMLVEVQRGNFQTDLGYIQVYTAPPSLERDLRFPLITMHLESEEPEDRAIGEDISGGGFDPVGSVWYDAEGWLARVELTIIAWSHNSDERIELRKALRRFVIANLPVLDGQGITQVSVSMQDIDAVNGEYGAPIYQVMASFSCLAPVRVGGPVDPITDVRSTVYG